MTASVPNANVVAPPGQTGATVHVKVTGGPLGGFEAIFASLFGQAAGQPTAADAPVAGAKGAALNLFATSEDAAGTPTDAEADPAADATQAEAGVAEAAVAAACPDPNLAGLALATTAKAPDATPATPTVETATPPAFGRDKAKGVPAAPALANANPHARLAEKAGLDAEDPPAADITPATPTSPPQKQAKLDLPQGPAPQGRPVEVAPADAKGVTPAETASVDPLPTTVIADAETAAALPETASPVATLAAKPGTQPPARGPQGPKGDRGRDAIDGPAAPRQAAAGRKATEGAFETQAADAAPAADREPGDASARTRLDNDAPDSATGHAETPLQTIGSTPTHNAHIPVRGAPEAVANLAAQIIKKLENRSTRFDLELNPAGLGKVDVRLEIGAAGQMSAAMTFDNPQTAAELKSRANDLQRALEQAGFNLSGGLSFDVAGDRGQAQQGWREAQDQSGHGHRGRAFQDALATADNAVDQAVSGALRLRRGLMSALDMRI